MHLTRGNPREELIAAVALLRAEAVSPPKLSALIDFVGSAIDLLPQGVGGADLLPSASLLLQGIDVSAIESAAKIVSDWDNAGLQARTVLDSDYPSNLQVIFNKPPLVFVAGRWDDPRDSHAVAVVGTRSATDEGKRRAHRLASTLARAGFTVISGLARGIDTAAHLGALASGGRTVAVLGTGIRRRYPRENAALADRILDSGALISQFFPDQPPTKWTFPVRNITMSGLSLATVVVEAGPTSGARMQAEAALKHGRSVFLPRSLVSTHEWARALIAEGIAEARAIEVATPDDVISHLELPADLSTLVA